MHFNAPNSRKLTEKNLRLFVVKGGKNCAEKNEL